MNWIGRWSLVFVSILHVGNLWAVPPTGRVQPSGPTSDDLWQEYPGVARLRQYQAEGERRRQQRRAEMDPILRQYVPDYSGNPEDYVSRSEDGSLSGPSSHSPNHEGWDADDYSRNRMNVPLSTLDVMGREYDRRYPESFVQRERVTPDPDLYGPDMDLNRFQQTTRYRGGEVESFYQRRRATGDHLHVQSRRPFSDDEWSGWKDDRRKALALDPDDSELANDPELQGMLKRGKEQLDKSQQAYKQAEQALKQALKNPNVDAASRQKLNKLLQLVHTKQRELSLPQPSGSKGKGTRGARSRPNQVLPTPANPPNMVPR